MSFYMSRIPKTLFLRKCQINVMVFSDQRSIIYLGRWVNTSLAHFKSERKQFKPVTLGNYSSFGLSANFPKYLFPFFSELFIFKGRIKVIEFLLTWLIQIVMYFSQLFPNGIKSHHFKLNTFSSTLDILSISSKAILKQFKALVII